MQKEISNTNLLEIALHSHLANELRPALPSKWSNLKNVIIYAKNMPFGCASGDYMGSDLDL